MVNARPVPHILKLRPYIPGGKLGRDGEPIALLASNENPLGPSPAAVEAMQQAAGGVHIYPDPTYTALRETIAAGSGIEAVDRIVLGSGSDEIINLLVQCYAGPGDEVLYPEHAFSMYRVYAESHGATPVAAPERLLTANVDALLDAVTPKTRICFLANPNNPTGTVLPLPELERLRAGLPGDVILALDGAYIAFLPDAWANQLRDMVDRFDNTVMIRTFSKMYGLAALRLGWGYFPTHIANLLQAVRCPWNINAMAVAAGVASFGDRDFISRTRAHNGTWRTRLRQGILNMGLSAPETVTNFVLAAFSSSHKAEAANQYLRANNILVRAIGGYGLPNMLRISVGTAGDNERCLNALRAYVHAHIEEA